MGQHCVCQALLGNRDSIGRTESGEMQSRPIAVLWLVSIGGIAVICVSRASALCASLH